jgi:hypothetical protein
VVLPEKPKCLHLATTCRKVGVGRIHHKKKRKEKKEERKKDRHSGRKDEMSTTRPP